MYEQNTYVGFVQNLGSQNYGAKFLDFEHYTWNNGNNNNMSRVLRSYPWDPVRMHTWSCTMFPWLLMAEWYFSYATEGVYPDEIT